MENYLLDTHTLIWYAGNDPRLPAATAELIADTTVSITISRATLWEIAIKDSLGKLILPQPYTQWLQVVRSYDFQVLEITDNHLNQLHTLPHHHRDPFDRLLIAQAISENLTLLSRDAHFSEYPVRVQW
ncbi:type II toxin-antitoxin system VapC family toxin [Hymenobacter weizhouensis]|uniref:type II toxin-antitoxin system VapC family toxin n=1 Tax=Hymenobacter sp. YIM 151500-1 TaxID=2987689 RepID=UPI002226FD83|nr:type II toxin-antitoxin system VapC family toxin [Hymenobacter sp. YIM 151500-1]UYZ61785.1 type II toxin-antitoxin system VapC family toxin [Hymenobacter sp. YIM 151500-1]